MMHAARALLGPRLECFSFVVLKNPPECRRLYSIMSRSPVLQQQRLLEKKAQQSNKVDPDKNRRVQNTQEFKQQEKRDPKSVQQKDKRISHMPILHTPGPMLTIDQNATAFLHKPPKQPENPHSLSIAMVGAPNAGKSTLVNWFVQDQVSAISPKAQTTRDRIMGIATDGDTQLLFFDTPGIVPSRNRSKTIQSIVTTAWETISYADVVVFIVDAARAVDENVTHIMQQLETNLYGVKKHLKIETDEEEAGMEEGTKNNDETDKKQEEEEESKSEGKVEAEGEGKSEDGKADQNTDKKKKIILHKPIAKDCILVLNKTDLVYPKDRLLEKITKYNETGLFKETFLVSALEGDRTDEIKEYLIKRAIPRPWEYDAELTTDLTPMQRVYEIIREKVFNRLNQEIPYLI